MQRELKGSKKLTFKYYLIVKLILRIKSGRIKSTFQKKKGSRFL